MKNLPNGVTIPGGGGLPIGGTVQVDSNAEANEFLTFPVNETYVVCTGTDFSYEGSPLFTLDDDCLISYIGGDPITLIVSMTASLQVTNVQGWATFISLNNELVDVPGEIFSSVAYAAGVALIQGDSGATDRGQDNVFSTRLLSLVSGDTFRPVGARSGGIGGGIVVATLTLNFIQIQGET